MNTQFFEHSTVTTSQNNNIKKHEVGKSQHSTMTTTPLTSHRYDTLFSEGIVGDSFFGTWQCLITFCFFFAPHSIENDLLNLVYGIEYQEIKDRNHEKCYKDACSYSSTYITVIIQDWVDNILCPSKIKTRK